MMRIAAAVSGLTVGSALLRIDTDRDVDQFLSVNLLVEDDSCDGGWHAVHPSFTFKPASKNMVVAFKGLCIKRQDDRVSWLSSLVLGEVTPQGLRNESRLTIDWMSLEVAHDPRLASNPDQQECMFPSLDEMSGVEDARLVRTPDGLYTVFNGFSLLEGSEGERPACGRQGILLHATKVESVKPPQFGKSVILRFPGMGRAEKPWAMFGTSDLVGAETRAVYSVYPHTIVKADLDSGNTRFEHHTFSKAVEKLARMYKTRPGNFNGGAAVAHVKTDEGDYFLSIMHTMVKKNGENVYWSFPYKFSIDAPYGITHVGKRLNLKLLPSRAYGDQQVARATTVMYDQGDVFIAYTAGDQSSRTIRMPLERFEDEYFNPSSSFREPSERAAFLAESEVFVMDSELAEVEPLDESAGCRDPTFNEMCSDRLSISVCRSCKEA